MRAVIGIHTYLGSDGEPLRLSAAFKVGLRGHTLTALDGAAPTPETTLAVVAPVCTLRQVALPFADPKKAAAVVPFELEGQVPFDIDAAVVTHELLESGRDGCRFLAAAAPIDRIAEVIDAHGGGGQPQVILPEAVGLFHFARAVSAGRPGSLLFVDMRPGRALLVQIADGHWQGAHAVNVAWQEGPELSDDDGMALLRAAHSLWLEAGVMPDGAVLVGDVDDGSRFAESLGLPPVPLAEFGASLSALSGGKLSEPEISHHALAIGLGLAAIDGKRTLNLRGGPFALAEAAEGVVLRRLSGMGVGVLVVLVVLWGNAWVRHQAAQTAFNNAKAALVAQYKSAFPDAGKIVDPVKQAKNAFKQLSTRALLYGGNGYTPLGYLDAVSRSIPKELSIDVYEFSIEGTRMRIEADAASFDAIDQIKAQLVAMEGVSDVRVSDAKMNSRGDRVKFRVHATLAEGV